MCDSVLPGYSCAQAPIDSNVVPAYDEHYRQEQTYIPTRYVDACEGEGCYDVEDYACDATGIPECDSCDVDTVEHMRGGGGGRGGGRGGRRGGGGRRRGGRRHGGWRRRGRGWGGYPYWRSHYYPYWYDYNSYYPYYYNYPHVAQSDTVVKVVEPRRGGGNMWWLPIGAALAVLYMAR